MRHAILALLVTLAGIATTAPSAADDPPGYFFLHDSTFNVTSEGTSIKVVGSDGTAACDVDFTTRIGNGRIANFNFAAILSLGDDCSPVLGIENVTGKTLTSDLWQFVRASQLDAVRLPMTWSQDYMEWYAVELSPPVYMTYEEGGSDYLHSGWSRLGEASYIVDPGCQLWEGECYHVHAYHVAEFVYTGYVFRPLCASNCHHWKEAHTEAWFMYPVPWCRTYGEVPYFSKEECATNSY